MRDRSRERLYRLLPDHLRALDAKEGRPLQALMQILAGELEVVEQDIDILYDNWFIETCEDWVVPYIGDLVGARGLRSFGEGSLRAYVANTLAYRQGKGTRAILEQVGRDVSGWPCVAVEFFKRLIQSQNVNHVRPDNLATMNLRNADLASLVHGPFEAANHNVEVRPIMTGEGRYNIPNVGLFVWRIQSYALSFAFDAQTGRLGGTVPAISPIGSGFRLLDPVGRPLRMFNRAATETALTEATTERSVPAPLRRRPVAADLRGLRNGTPAAGAYFGLRPVLQVHLANTLVTPEKLFACDLSDQPDGMGGTTWKRPAQAGQVMFDPELGRLSLHPNDENKQAEVTYAYGRPHDIGGGPYDRSASVDAWIDPFRQKDEAHPLWQVGVTVRSQIVTLDLDQGGPVVNSLQKAIARWNTHATPGARGIIVLMDDATYDEDLTDPASHIGIPAGARLAIVAGGWPAEPKGGGVLRREPGWLSPQERRPVITSDIVVRGMGPAGEAAGALVLDGLWVAGTVRVASGDLGHIEIRHSSTGLTDTALKTGLVVLSGAQGNNDRLDIVLSHCLSGPLDAGKAAGTFSICDSLIGEDRVADGDSAAMPLAIEAPNADLAIMRSTVFGRTVARTIEADDTIFVGPLDIARRQDGCLRFCYLPRQSRTPRRYRCAPDLQVAEAKEAAQAAGDAFQPEIEQALVERIRPVFTATVAEHFAFGQLSRRCPVEIADGGEAGREMGAMNGLFNPMRAANIRDALDEYLPFGLAAGVFFMN
ncbi:hypothetical protein [Rhizobium terrae]|uniref:hypothetical protein n=1 Tax=Rhizobium terrae TaxID=2171756 RepID=UPI000E3E996D|nr:hypothetical protein [Rhizobium terrae]